VEPKLVDSVHGPWRLTDGRGHDDIARLLPVLGGAYESQVSYEGNNIWQTIRTLLASTSFAGIGRFDESPALTTGPQSEPALRAR
jgi:hypothetical protein